MDVLLLQIKYIPRELVSLFRAHHIGGYQSPQYGGYDAGLVIEWARVRIPNKAWIHLREEKPAMWITVSNGKQYTPSVLCWDHRL
ncbi:hypothetical protein TNCV_4168511 [Trichonephila clavipes]|nr:hypothetical protein TNCV_4168511 [Trichonephila clavipes]